MKQREPYEKPALGVIELKAEEVLAVGCKSPVKAAVGQPICFVVPCSVNGS